MTSTTMYVETLPERKAILLPLGEVIESLSEIVDATLYRQTTNSLMYLMNTRPDICLVVNTLSQYMVESRHVHLVATKHVLRYLKGTVDFGLQYGSDREGYVVD
jgi:hypothetical protein